jgi:hypothetical protein
MACFVALPLLTLAMYCGGAAAGGDDTAVSVEEAGWFYAADHEQELTAFLINWHGTQHLSCVDMFGASAKLARCFRRQGFDAECFDIKIGGRSMDIMTRTGVDTALDMGMRMVDGGLFFAGPPCSLFGGMCMNIHKRYCPWLGPEGDTSSKSIRLANGIVKNSVTWCSLEPFLGSCLGEEGEGNPSVWVAELLNCRIC